MKRKLLFLVLIAFIVIVAYFYLRPPETVLSADRVYNVTQKGEVVPVNVTLSNVPGCSGWNMRLTWDPDYLQPTGITEGPFFQTLNMSSFFHITSLDYANGEMIIADVFMAKETYVQGTGVILTVNFTTVRVGASTIEFHSPVPNGTAVSLGDAQNQFAIDHVEVDGLISNEAPPPVWASTDFQNTLIVAEVAVLSLASGAIYLRVHPRPPRVAKRREELRPIVDPEDQTEST